MEDMMTESMIGCGRQAVDMIIDEGTFQENSVGSHTFDPDYGPAAVVGTAKIDGTESTVIAIDAQAFNDRFPVVYLGVIGLEEAYKMASAVYETMEADKAKKPGEKRPIVLIVDTPGNAPGKVEEIVGMNKATGAYQLALAEARRCGHPVVAMVIGRAISGAFLCHGLQADHILALSKEYGTTIHVMPITSISRITKIEIDRLEVLAKDNPVFASGVDFFYKLGGVEEIVSKPDDMKEAVRRHVSEITQLKLSGNTETLGPSGRGILGASRKGRTTRARTISMMEAEFDEVAEKYLS